MDKPALYMETTIPSFMLAEPSRDLVANARQEITRDWWRRDHARFDVFISETVLDEAVLGDHAAAAKRRDFLAQFPRLMPNPEVKRLASLYIQQHIVPAEKPGDAVHLAFAAAYRIQFLCTWNFRHLANAVVLCRLRKLNEKRGLFTPQVCTPEELLGE